MNVSRRTVVSGLATLTGALTLNRCAMARALAEQRPAAGTGGGKDLLSGSERYPTRLRPFAMTEVRLLPGVFREQAEINQRYLDSLDGDRLLHSFRLTSGLTSTGVPYGGWEKPDCELRGHFNGGHYLSAVALAYASSGNETLRRNGDAVVAGLAGCQRANGNGYLSAYPEGLFETLARGGRVWAPFYTLHKIMAGLVDMYVHTGNEQALAVAEGAAGWVEAYFQGIHDDQRQFLLRTEYGGMNEVLANLAGLTGRERYLHLARLFEQPAFLDPLAMRRDVLKGLHANTHVPKAIGAARMYELTGETRYREIATYFLDEVLAARSYAIGNTSLDEHWRTDPGDLKGTLGYHDAECCVAYNLMKLERHVFSWTGEARWMDAYERSLWNCRLGTQDGHGLKQYFFPLAAGYWRHVNSPDASFWCCTGTGAEEFAKFNDSIYFHDGASLWVNQFIPSELVWKDAGLTLRQETAFPAEQGTTLRFKTTAPQRRTVHIRIPSWVAGEDGSVAINGRALEAFAQPGSYLAITREWRDGDKVEVALPMSAYEEVLPGDPGLRAALYGPLVLAAVLGPGPESGPLKVGAYDTGPKDPGPPAANPAGSPELISARELTFRAGGGGRLPVRPMYRIRDERYAVYWSRPG
ncbi:MAG: glycoside hydrolase family 127 protein [Acidobacteriota bacterium]|nr:glycoside hydrolase family 127 protein [Acidobacteriota bacterium]